jgi:hypothetical protein
VRDVAITGNSAIFNVLLVVMSIKYPGGSPFIDQRIANEWGVDLHPYTSDDSYAQDLLPTGWSWGGTYSNTGMYYAVRDSDGQRTRNMFNASGGSRNLPAPMSCCLAAAEARTFPAATQRAVWRGDA